MRVVKASCLDSLVLAPIPSPFTSLCSSFIPIASHPFPSLFTKPNIFRPITSHRPPFFSHIKLKLNHPPPPFNFSFNISHPYNSQPKLNPILEPNPKSTMKREHPFSTPCALPPEATGKSKIPVDDTAANAGMDELLAVLGYKVRSSDMAEVAQKLEQLEVVMGNVEKDGLSELTSETVHYNPSDLSTWLESMLSEFNPLPPNFDPSSSSSSIIDPPPHSVGPFSDSDLKAIPGMAILTPPPLLQQQQQISSSSNSLISSGSSSRESKRLKPTNYSPRPVLLVDSQENGIKLVHTLMACAEAVQQDNLVLAEALVKKIGYFAASQAGSMRKVATYFAEALARKIYKLCSSPYDDNLSDTLQDHFYESCPYLKFAHFSANQAILDAFSGKKYVHVIDFSLQQGMQWPALMQALAVRVEGPPAFRLTAVGPDNSGRFGGVGCKLGQFAESIQIKFKYDTVLVNNLVELETGLFDIKPDDTAIAINSVFELHKLLAKPGAIEKVLGVIKDLNPVIVTVAEQEANHNGPVFLDRFNESLHYYSTLFDSLQSCVDSQDKAMSEVYLGRQICNVVACEGLDRVERHETLVQWKTRFGLAGLNPVHLGSNAFRLASMLLEYFAGGDGYGVVEREGCLMLGWHSRPLITSSAWELGQHSVVTRSLS